MSFFLLLVSCTSENSVESNVLDNSIFSELDPAQTGLEFSNDLKPDTRLNILEYLYYYNGGGVAIGDINGDGLEDVYLTANQKPDKLFLNKGDLHFEDISASAGIEQGLDWATGVTMDDVNNDGLMDIYVCIVDPVTANKTHNRLYINQGDLTFKEMSTAYGLDFSGFSTQASFFDYDNDGDLDMYLLNHSIHSVRSYGKVEKRNEKDALAGDRLFESQINQGEEKFIDVTEKAGIYSSALGYGLSVATADVNGDGYDDIYVANDFHENDYLYINQGNKTFTERNKLMAHTSKFSMGVDIADMNNDGLQDIFTTDMLPYDVGVAMRSGGEDTDQIFQIRKDLGFEDQYARNHFQLQQSNGQFSDIALMTKTYATDWSWAVLLNDFDNNGLQDIFISNGIVKRPNDLDYIKYINQNEKILGDGITQQELDDVLAIMPSQKLSNFLFTQDAHLEFSSLNKSAIGSPSFSNGAAYADLDHDGDLDLIVNNINASASVFENNTKQSGKSSGANNYIQFSFPLPKATIHPKGSNVKVCTKGVCQTKLYANVKGYQSSSSHILHFGLGNAQKVDSVVVTWKHAGQSTWRNIDVNQTMALSMDKELKSAKSDTQSALFNTSVWSIAHQENDFKDYNYEKLIPERLSAEGPAAVSADFNQDGIKDIFLGGGKFQEAKLFLGNRSGAYKMLQNKDFKRDAKYEDVHAATIDFDKDGDLDLYVVSGGSQNKELDKELEDRLYLNDGKGNLKRIPLSLPHTNGSCVAVGDFDQDGYDDLFVGARNMPFFYGLSPYSFILRNKNGTGVEISDQQRWGMVTDAQWVDIDNDDDLDLVMCGDWMNVTILENDNTGKFKDVSEKYNLGDHGMWNGIALKDLNNDGMLDIIAANTGLNFKMSASSDQHITMTIADTDNNGAPEPIISYPYFGKEKLFYGLDMLSAQTPIFRKQFQTYKDFSKVDQAGLGIQNIVEEKYIDELGSCMYLSKDGQYDKVLLPKEAQLSTIQDLYFTSEGDLVYVGNHHDYLTELGTNQANSGGVFSNFNLETQSYDVHQSLGLAPHINTREIVELTNNRYLVVCNNDYQYFIDLN